MLDAERLKNEVQAIETEAIKLVSNYGKGDQVDFTQTDRTGIGTEVSLSYLNGATQCVENLEQGYRGQSYLQSQQQVSSPSSGLELDGLPALQSIFARNPIQVFSLGRASPQG